jgi:hypothetical protein
VTATIVGADPRISVKAVIATRYVWRDANDAEVGVSVSMGGPLHGGVHRILEPEDIGTSDGSVPLSVPAAATVEVVVAFTVPADHPDDVMTGTLSIAGTTWDPVEVPVTLLSGTGDAVITMTPPAVRVAVEPGATVPAGVRASDSPVDAQVLAHLSSPDPDITLQVLVFLPEHRAATPEELAQMPIQMRAQAERDGITQLREIHRGDGSTPLHVPLTGIVQVNLQITGPVGRDSLTNSLVIAATAWQRIEVPITVFVGKIGATVSPAATNAPQGGTSGVVQATLTSEAGPDTDVYLSLAQRGFGAVSPAVTNLAKGQTRTVPFQVTVSPEAPIGTHQPDLRIDAFEQLYELDVGLELSVTRAPIEVTPQQAFLSGTQGGTATCQVQITSYGGYKRLTFAVGVLPPGVTLVSPPVWEKYGAATDAVVLDFAVAPDAPPVAGAAASIIWDAGDGQDGLPAQQGVLDLYLTVVLVPDSRTFSAVVTTPAGTALGGHVELTLSNDGSGRFKGEMYATALASYKFNVRVLIRSASGASACLTQKAGEVHGTFDPGHTTFDWDEPVGKGYSADDWNTVKNGVMATSKSYEMSGVLGTLVDVAIDVVEFVAADVVLSPVPGGAALASLVFFGTDLQDLTDVHLAGPGGVVGLIAAGGALCLLGPFAIIPAYIGGVLLTDELLFKSRSMTAAEVAFAGTVFGDTLPIDKILLTNINGPDNKHFTVPNVDGTILVNLGDDPTWGAYNDPVNHADPKGKSYDFPGQVFIHELTHAWQIAHSSWTYDVFWKAAKAKLQGQSAYDYGPPTRRWEDWGLEQAASIVDEWFAGDSKDAPSNFFNKPRTAHDPEDPYFHYISDNIRLGQN